ncbi:hypothetical protein HHK36_016380 [Tetracentron sinense]|uniref:Uncharacterized protein n=1 Tax=Tetracentron sinense TaxID=13715 RepID=A0A834Z3B5_TETSI|nr:hypothetical protein HHK36_016380 [Tetracentron sinense]
MVWHISHFNCGNKMDSFTTSASTLEAKLTSCPISTATLNGNTIYASTMLLFASYCVAVRALLSSLFVTVVCLIILRAEAKTGGGFDDGDIWGEI